MNAMAKKRASKASRKDGITDMGNTGRKKKAKRKATEAQARQQTEAPEGNIPAKADSRGIRRSSRNTRDTFTTKTDQILALLKQPSGATLNQIMEATGWQAHSVRGFISGHVVKKIGLRVESFRRDGERVYSIKR